MSTMLLIEDHAPLRDNLREMLTLDGFRVLAAENGRAGLELAAREVPDLILCDVMMPELDGHGVLQALRADPATRSTPFIFLTARGEKPDVRSGMDLGADDYLTKPFDLNVLLARIRRLLKSRSWRAEGIAPDEACFDNVQVDFNSLTAEVRGKGIRLTYKEAQILKLLWEKRNQIVSREELLKKIWGVEGYIQSRTVDNHIVQLRKLLEENPKKPKYILSIHGSGYKFVTAS